MFDLEKFYEEVARQCHEANRAYCKIIGDNTQVSWEDAPQWQRDSAINGVKYHYDNRDSKPEDSHVSWLLEKKANGWVYGAVKDPIAKTHPCVVEYAALPMSQKIKDYIFWAIVQAALVINNL